MYSFETSDICYAVITFLLVCLIILLAFKKVKQDGRIREHFIISKVVDLLFSQVEFTTIEYFSFLFFTGELENEIRFRGRLCLGCQSICQERNRGENIPQLPDPQQPSGNVDADAAADVVHESSPLLAEQ